jgi:PadR family transcriptional regulator, regulatory protein PadR
MARRISAETAAVLRFFLRDPATERYGLEVLRGCALSSGSLYPILARLEGRDVLVSRRGGEHDEAAPGRPRRYYRLTSSGIGYAEQALAERDGVERRRRVALRRSIVREAR